MKFPKDHVSEALQACGPRAQACVDYCLWLAQDGEAKPFFDSAATLCEEASVADAFRELGYSLETATRPLEQCDFSFAAATRLLLYGGDTASANDLHKTRFRRHTRRGVRRQTLRSYACRCEPCTKSERVLNWD